jgi:hypothetical protein
MNENKHFYYTIAEFLEYYPMGRSSLYRIVGAGDLCITKFGRSSRISVSDAEAWASRLPTFQGTAHNDNG